MPKKNQPDEDAAAPRANTAETVSDDGIDAAAATLPDMPDKDAAPAATIADDETAVATLPDDAAATANTAANFGEEVKTPVNPKDSILPNLSSARKPMGQNANPSSTNGIISPYELRIDLKKSSLQSRIFQQNVILGPLMGHLDPKGGSTNR